MSEAPVDWKQIALETRVRETQLHLELAAVKYAENLNLSFDFRDDLYRAARAFDKAVREAGLENHWLDIQIKVDGCR